MCSVPDDRLDDFVQLMRRVCVTFVQKVIRMEVGGRAQYIREESHDEAL
jgi:hypothetical protein